MSEDFDSKYMLKSFCERCKKDFSKSNWEKYKIYEGLDTHHNPPQFMFENKNDWKGTVINLCRKHHKELHQEILKIMFKYSSLFKPIKSEHWTWIKITPNDRLKVIEEVITFTEEWIK